MNWIYLLDCVFVFVNSLLHIVVSMSSADVVAFFLENDVLKLMRKKSKHELLELIKLVYPGVLLAEVR